MTLSRRSPFLALVSLTLTFLLCTIVASSLLAQSQPEPVSKRRLLERPQPPYPSLARTLRLEGVVRIDAIVSPDGSVKAVEIKGGHPVLADAAANAVRHWKWERAAQESTEAVEVKFTRPN